MINKPTKTYDEIRKEKKQMMHEIVTPHDLKPHEAGHRIHIPPHERKNMVYMEFDAASEEALSKMFGSTEEAEIAINILHDAPPEHQIIAHQLLRQNGVNVKARYPKSFSTPIRFSSPILGEEIGNAYTQTYGEDGSHYIDVLESSPYEFSVISRMIEYMQEQKGE